MVKIDILIPTYNRPFYLLKNLSILKNNISNLDPQKVKIEIIISDNGSVDGSLDKIREFIHNNNQLKVRLIEQNQNIGFCNNLLFLVGYSKADYIITLGDDDYIDSKYLEKAISEIIIDPDITCILPAVQAISESGERLGIGRDLGQKATMYEAGIRSAKYNSHRAHQISGIILKREGLLEALTNNNISNLYPQIFMVAYACLHGKCLHLPEYPVLVTVTSKKAWSYDNIGLLNDIFANFSALHLKDSDQFKLEFSFIRNQYWRAFKDWKSPIKQIKNINNISNNSNTSIRGHLLLPPILFFYWIKILNLSFKGKIQHALNKE